MLKNPSGFSKLYRWRKSRHWQTEYANYVWTKTSQNVQITPLQQHAFKCGTDMWKSNLYSIYVLIFISLFFSHLALWFNLRIGKHNVLPSQNNGQKRTLGLLNFNKVLQATFPRRNCFVYFPYGDPASCLLSTQSCWNHSQLFLSHTHIFSPNASLTPSHFLKINIKSSIH